MPTAVWLETGSSGQSNLDAAMPQMALAIPLGGRLVRVVYSGTIGGRQVQDGASSPEIGDCYYLATLLYQRSGFADKTLHLQNTRIPMQAVRIDDHNLLTANRVATGYMGAGDQEIGYNLQMSWGGPGKGAAVIRITRGVFRMISGTANWLVWHSGTLRALYYI
jgi:hypothetical protein